VEKRHCQELQWQPVNFHVAQQQNISSFSRKAGFILDKWYESQACPRGLGWHLAHPNSPLGNSKPLISTQSWSYDLFQICT
jgi:hypothetical protein